MKKVIQLRWLAAVFVLCAIGLPCTQAQTVQHFILCRDTTSTGAGLNACAFPANCLYGGSLYPCAAPIARPTGFTYTDASVVDGTTYYYVVGAVGPGGSVSTPPSLTITAVAGSSGTLTFTANSTPVTGGWAALLASGQGLLLSGFSTDTSLNGQAVNVLSAGLSSSQFEAVVTGSGYSNDTGSAVGEAVATIPGTGSHSVLLTWNDSGGFSAPEAAVTSIISQNHEPFERQNP